jgi:hypothetical protein
MPSDKIGFGLRKDTTDLLQVYQPGLIHTASAYSADAWFPLAKGLTILVAMNLDQLEAHAKRGPNRFVDYLGYNPERSDNTPPEEHSDVPRATREALRICRRNCARLMLGPGGRLMDDNPDWFRKVAIYPDAYYMQTQIYQTDLDGYRQRLHAPIAQLRADRPDLPIYGQISTNPGPHDLTPDQWCEYFRRAAGLFHVVNIYDGRDVSKPAKLSAILHKFNRSRRDRLRLWWRRIRSFGVPSLVQDRLRTDCG